jgi:tRNA A-37 threonylcarbamoyl transferase component Bud32
MPEQPRRPDERREALECTEPGAWPLDVAKNSTDEEIDALVLHAETCPLHNELFDRWNAEFGLEYRRALSQSGEFRSQVLESLRNVKSRGEK